MNISIYLNGGRISTEYYRIYQYFDIFKDKGYKITYRTELSDKQYRKFMPVSQQPFLIKMFFYILIFFKVLYSLLLDIVFKKDIIIIRRRLISRYTPFLFIIILKIIKIRGTKLVWDFDDRIVESEVSWRVFNTFSKLSDVIVVTHSYLKSLIMIDCQSKVILLPTTDKDMYKNFNEELNKKRLEILKNQIILIWVGTSVNLDNLVDIVSFLDNAADKISQKYSKQLILKVVCDKPFFHDTKNIIIENIKWTRDDAINEMYKSHIGIMPLKNVEYSKGKGGFKLVQYISIGLPCIASAVGFNKFVVSKEFGFLIEDNEDWFNAIIALSEMTKWNEYSNNAYKHWLKNFSFEYNYNKWNDIIDSLAQ